MFGLIGPDGAGKTTTIRMVCGLLARGRGRVRACSSCDPVRDHRRLTDSVGYLSQRFSLYGDLSVDENIAFFAEIHGLRDYRARRDRLLEMTQLAPFRARLADRLSGGMKQKLALACTLVHEPALIVLDEPTTGVDPVSRREFWKLLSEFLSEGITIVMATPYLDEAERCSRVALLHDGASARARSARRLRSALPGALFEVIVADHRRARRGAVRHAGDRRRAVVRRARARPHVFARRRMRAALLRSRLEASDLTVGGIRPIRTSLEDVFIARLERGCRMTRTIALVIARLCVAASARTRSRRPRLRRPRRRWR